MKRVILSAMAGLLLAVPAQAQSAGDIFRSIFGGSSKETAKEENQSSTSTGQILSGMISQSDADAGLREALIIGARAVSGQLSATDGYFGDDAIRIPLPGRLGDIQKQLSRLGMSGPLDDLQLRMNRAAEDAAPKAVDLVIDAVQSLTIDDAMSLLNGGDTAATDLLRLKTEDELTTLLRPYVETALDDAGALQLADRVISKYRLSQYNVNPREELVDHAVDEALDGLFFYLAKEEQGIRNNPVERTTDLLKRVFGG